jgi:hypothetical protein
MSDTFSVAVDCKKCSQAHVIEVSEKGWNAWQLEGKLIQAAMPELTADEREILISGICGKCFDAIFAGCD